MRLRRFIWFFLVLIVVFVAVNAEDGAQDDGNDDAADDGGGNDDGAAQDDGAAAADDGAQADDGGNANNNGNNGDDDGQVVADDGGGGGGDDDYIEYWTGYAVLPKRCIVVDGVDVIMFSVFEDGYKQCSDQPSGTYITPVPYFVDAYLDQVALIEEDKGNEDYERPESSMYTACIQTKIQNNMYYVQVGCSDLDTQQLSVNIYEENTCETKSTIEGMDDANIDISDIEIPFKLCQACVSWVDSNEDDVDDMFYENRQKNAPLCSQVWAQKESCGRRCQHIGRERREREGWNTSDKILLSILSFFGAAMLVAILRKRRDMSNKDALLEQAAMSAAGLQQTHVIGVFVLVVLVIMVFALLGLKNITWALLLIMNTVLFGYLMKLTVDSGVSTGETVIGPDGRIIHTNNSDDSSVESAENPNAGTYSLPQIA